MTKSTPSPFLSGEEVCKILESAAKAQVTELKFRELYVSFAYKPPVDLVLAPGPAIPVHGSANEQREQANEQSKELLTEEIRTREAQIEELWITDPALAEKMLEEGELEKAPEALNDDDGAGTRS